MIDSLAFVGLGYIGLPTAVVLAQSGVKVVGVDVYTDRVAQINSGSSPIVEPGLEEALRTTLENGNFKAQTEMPETDAYVVAVPTPFADGYKVDTSFIFSAADAIAPKLREGTLVVLESTSPPGTTRQMADRILENRPDLAADGDDNPDGKPVVYFAHCPERILPGKALEELRTNDRIIGGMSPRATELATEIYRSFCDGELLPTDDVTAEMAKLTENSFRDVNIAFANELSIISDKLGIDVWELIELANHHPRVNILQPGPGVGGHCIAVDPWFIVSSDPENSRIIRTAREINDSKPKWVLSKVEEAVRANPDSTIAVLGLAFKANIDDLRESPSLKIAEDIASNFGDSRVLAVEPNVAELPSSLSEFENVELAEAEKAVESADVVVLLVDHNEFVDLWGPEMTNKTVIDTKGLWLRQS